MGVGLKGGSPYRACALNGWVLDGEGRAMHKSLGNVIEPEEIIKHHGAEVLRLWVASVEFNEDVRISETILTRLTEAYRKLRNTFRYALGNLRRFRSGRRRRAGRRAARDRPVDPAARRGTGGALPRAGTKSFEFHRSITRVYDFATVDLSAIYFDVLKDRLYTTAPRSQARRSAQTALWRLAHALVRLLAPLLTLHRRRGLDPHGAARRACTWRCSPSPAS